MAYRSSYTYFVEATISIWRIFEKLYVVSYYILSKIEFTCGYKISFLKLLFEILVLSLDSWSVTFFINICITMLNQSE